MSSNHLVLATGSSSGFGRLSVETLARKGHLVFATAWASSSSSCMSSQLPITLAVTFAPSSRGSRRHGERNIRCNPHRPMWPSSTRSLHQARFS